MFCVFEGIDGSGKTSLINKVSNYLDIVDEFGVEYLKFPNENTLTYSLISRVINGEEISSKTKALLYSTNRSESQEEIANILIEDKIILCDRYSHSGLATAMSDNISYDWLNTIEKTFIQPDIVFFLDTCPVICNKRMMDGEYSEIVERRNFQEKVWMNYLKCFDQNNWVVLDGTKSVEELVETVLFHLRKLCIKKNRILNF